MCGFEVKESAFIVNSFNVKAQVARLVEVSNLDDLKLLQKNKVIDKNTKILGHGYNSIPKTVDNSSYLKICDESIQVICNKTESILVEVSAGCPWDAFVKWTTKNKYVGLENLSSIPGSVGAAPIHNIGAYGYEVSSFIESVTVFNLETCEFLQLSNKDCIFEYRTSIFKEKNNFVVCKVTFKLFHSNSSALKYLGENNGNIFANIYSLVKLTVTSFNLVTKPHFKIKFKFDNIRDILKSSVLSAKIKRKLVKKIRKVILTDPLVTGNVGCFFKCPIMTKTDFSQFLLAHPDCEYFEENTNVKISACWLIRGVGWAGKVKRNVKVDVKKPVVLLNNGGATGEDVTFVSSEIITDIKNKYQINIEPEAVFY